MSMAATNPTATEASGTAGTGLRLRHRLRGVLVAGAVVLAAAAEAVVIAGPFTSTASTKGVADNAYPTSLKTVTCQDLSEQTQDPGSDFEEGHDERQNRR